LIASAAAHLRSTARSAAIDTAQVQLYDLALCKAEVAAASALTAIASAAESTDLERRITATFCAEAIVNLQQRLTSRPTDYGLTVTDVNLVEDPFIGTALSAEA